MITQTASFRPADPGAPTPTPRPIVNIALLLSSVDPSLFRGAQQAATLVALTTAMSLATGIDAASIAVRRMRDITYPLAPVVVFVNPNFAGDEFPARRRLGSGAGIVSVDVQLQLANNGAAAALATRLASASLTLAESVRGALLAQGSAQGTALGDATIAATVQPYENTAARANGAAASIAPGAAAGAVIVLALLAAGVYYYARVVRRRAAVADASVASAGPREGFDSAGKRDVESASRSSTYSSGSADIGNSVASGGGGGRGGSGGGGGGGGGAAGGRRTKV